MSRVQTALLFLAFTLATASAHPLPPLAGTYSNFSYNEAEGDVTGLEITIIPSGSAATYAYHAMVQTADGVTAPPQLVALRVQAVHVIFSFHYPGAGLVTFTGQLEGSRLVGKLTGTHFSATAYSLPRQNSFWQPTL